MLKLLDVSEVHEWLVSLQFYWMACIAPFLLQKPGASGALRLDKLIVAPGVTVIVISRWWWHYGDIIANMHPSLQAVSRGMDLSPLPLDTVESFSVRVGRYMGQDFSLILLSSQIEVGPGLGLTWRYVKRSTVSFKMTPHLVQLMFQSLCWRALTPFSSSMNYCHPSTLWSLRFKCLNYVSNIFNVFTWRYILQSRIWYKTK